MKHTSVVALALAAAAAASAKQPLERYQSIIDRQMFGELPAGFDPTKMPSEVARSSAKQGQELTKEQEKLQSSIHFSVINMTPDGATAVGFTDNSNPKAPVHYYLKVGETRDGWNVVEADAKAATMTIAKGDIEVSLSLGGNSGKGGGTTSRAGAGAEAGGGSGMLRTLRGRRALREKREADALQKMRDEQAAKDAERAAKAEEDKAQREAEREEQRKQLMAIQEELRRAREEKEKAQQQRQQQSDDDANNDAE